MDVSEWQRTLEDNFSVNGVIGPHLLEVLQMEKENEKHFISTYHGQDVLINCFQSFFIETIKSAYNLIRKNGWPKGVDGYGQVLLYFVIMFRSFRACENLLFKGYPFDGFALLRDLKDRAIFMCAIAHNISSFSRLYGYDAKLELKSPEDIKKLKDVCMKEENRIQNMIIRKESGLLPDILSELAKWERLFNHEVHGSKFSFLSELHIWISESKPPPIGPVPNLKALGMYMNRACEIAWLIVRLLPYLQPSENAFGEEWQKKHLILDDSFLYAQKGLAEIGKKIGDAFIFFVDQKFSFDAPFFYFEADGSKA
jgi:hypothetical protein